MRHPIKSLLLTVLCAGAWINSPAASRQAADLDWREREQLDPATAAELNPLCAGVYVDPTPDATPETHATAVADSAFRETDKSTVLTGNVVVRQGTREVRGPKVALDEQTEVADIGGPMQYRDRGILVLGDAASGNLFDSTVTVDGASFVLHEPGLRGDGAQLARDNDGNITIRDGRFTLCEPGTDTWAIAGETISLVPESGWGTARKVTLRMGDVPVAWSPYLRFPINDERQSGFLLPNLSYDDDNGVEFGTPYYFNLAPNYDATYMPRSIWKRGFLHEGQVRYKHSAAINELNLGYLRADDIFDDRETIDQTDLGLAPPFREQDRWFFNVRHTGGWGGRWRSVVRYSAVSDLDYLHDIGGEVDSVAVEQFLSRVDTTLGNRRTAALDRSLRLTYTGSGWDAGLALSAFQSLDPTAGAQYERLPSIFGNWSTRAGAARVRAKGAMTQFESDAISGERAITGSRLDGGLSVSLPWRKPWGFVVPELSVDTRRYSLNRASLERASPATPADDTPTLTVPIASLDAGLVFERNLTIGGRTLLQTLEPRMFYLYAPDETQDRLPVFDVAFPTQSYDSLFRRNRFSGADRIGDANELTLGVTTRFLDAKGAQRLSASAGQVFYFDNQDVLHMQPTAIDPTAPRSALFTSATLNLAEGLRARASFSYDYDEGLTHRGEFNLHYAPDPFRLVNVSYRYGNGGVIPVSAFQSLEESDVSFIWPIRSGMSLIGRWNFGWDENQTIESFFGVEFNDCCWKSRIVWRRFLKEPRNLEILVPDATSPNGFMAVNRLKSRPDVGIFIELQLKGLATLGSRLDSLLDQAMVGYRERENQIGQ